MVSWLIEFVPKRIQLSNFYTRLRVCEENAREREEMWLLVKITSANTIGKTNVNIENGRIRWIASYGLPALFLFITRDKEGLSVSTEFS